VIRILGIDLGVSGALALYNYEGSGIRVGDPRHANRRAEAAMLGLWGRRAVIDTSSMSVKLMETE
jgi:hypothetical protein